MKTRNLTNELIKRVKETNCPIHNELNEQYQQTQNYKFFESLRCSNFLENRLVPIK